MLLFGVTGGIGCGKSAVCRFLKNKGIPILEADPAAKELTNRLPQIRRALSTEFGEKLYKRDGELDTERLSRLVFGDPAARQRVNAIVHPYVLSWIEGEVRRLRKADKTRLLGVEAALIYEAGMESMLDRVVVVSAPLAKRLIWLQARNGLSVAEIQRRMDTQMPLAEKVARADYVVHNDGSLGDLEMKVDRLYAWLTAPF